ncbi:MAG TPA: flagellar biosynthesis protein FlgA [Acetivibrio clariflavus]|nr:flagellar biosynthesis protein FlgA [Acetivibrio clariflavus]HPU41026.1 flagellar biosynthesis protein FlgA [Acetivibrio clariflavus]
MDINSLKHIKPGSNLPKKIAAILVSVLVVIASFSYLNSVNSDAKEVVEIAVVKPSEGIPEKELLTESLIKKGKILKTDFKEGMVTYDKVNEVLNKYAAYFLRHDTPIYYDQLSDSVPVKHEWLYELPKESEVLTIPYDYDKCGGEILAPGDYVRVRVTYEDTDNSPSEATDMNPYFNTSSLNKKKYVTEVLFDRILVKDMLNSKGQSISEILKEVSRLGEEERKAVMESKEFLQNIQAKSLVFEATPEQVDKYTKSNSHGTFTFTILSRMDNTNFVEQLSAADKEVKEWTSNGKE